MQQFGRYIVMRKLGAGGMADVYLAHDPQLDRRVAVKMLSPSLAPPNAPLPEARRLASFTHPNIVRIFDTGEAGGALYMVMEYVGGGTLEQLTGAPRPYREAARLLLPIADALQYAHRQGIIHRDVKPSNILLRAGTQEPVLSDFGISQLFRGAAFSSGSDSRPVLDTLARAALAYGTPHYMSPEQCQGRDADPRSDIYSLGVVLYELLTGRRPFTADTPWGVAIRQVHEPPPPLSDLVLGLPPAVQALIDRALAKQPDGRYADMAAMQRDLQALADLQRPQSGMRALEDAPSAPAGDDLSSPSDGGSQHSAANEVEAPAASASEGASADTGPLRPVPPAAPPYPRPPDSVWPPAAPSPAPTVPSPAAPSEFETPAESYGSSQHPSGNDVQAPPFPPTAQVPYPEPTAPFPPAWEPAAPPIPQRRPRSRLLSLLGGLLALCLLLGFAAGLVFWPALREAVSGGPPDPIAAAVETRRAETATAAAAPPGRPSPVPTEPGPAGPTPDGGSPPAAIPSAPPAATPADTPAALDAQVERFMADYYAAVNRRDYPASWQMLSDNYKTNRPDRDNYNLYVDWWNSFDRVELLSVNVTVVDPQRRIANAAVRLRYHSPTRGVIEEGYTYRVVFNEALGGWQIDM